MLRGTGFRVCPDDESVVDGNVTTQGPLLRNYGRGINFGSLAECSEVKTSSVTSALKISLSPQTNGDVQMVWKFHVNSLFRNVAGYARDSEHTSVSRFGVRMPNCEFLWHSGPVKEIQLKYSLAFGSQLLAA